MIGLAVQLALLTAVSVYIAVRLDEAVRELRAARKHREEAWLQREFIIEQGKRQ